MSTGRQISAEVFFAAHPGAVNAYERISELLGGVGGCTVSFTKSQVAFRRRGRSFAFLWTPGQYLRKPTAPAVLTIALGRAVDSPRFKQVVNPSPGQWMHHLEIGDVADLDDEVRGWLLEASSRS